MKETIIKIDISPKGSQAGVGSNCSYCGVDFYIESEGDLDKITKIILNNEEYVKNNNSD